MKAVSLFVVPLLLAVPAFPYGYGITPSGANTADATTFYNTFKGNYYVTCNGAIMVVNSPHGNYTVSEGQGYGFLMTAYLEPDATGPALMKQLLAFKVAAEDANHLMNWSVNCGSYPNNGSATDGDMDMAEGLLEANKRWPGNGFDSAATTIINAILANETDSCGIGPGDASGFTSCSGYTYPSYFAMSYLTSFQCFTGNTAWATVKTNAYNQLNYWYANYTLPPETINMTGGTYNGGQYQYNSCRVPWRLSLDYLWNGNTNAYNMCKKIVANFETQNPSPSTIGDGYNYMGGAENSTNHNAAFTGPAGDGAMCNGNSGDQAYLNAEYTNLTSLATGTYYQDAHQVLSLMTQTGILTDPCGGAPVNTNTPTGTPTSTPTPTKTNTPVNTSTSTPTPTGTPTPTKTNTPLNTSTGTLTSTSTSTSTRTNTPLNTSTPTSTGTPTSTRTNTPLNTSTPTNTVVNTSTTTSTPSWTGTATPSSTSTRTNTPLNTATPTATSVFTLTNTSTPSWTGTATPSPTSTRTNTPLNTATSTATSIYTLTSTSTPSWTGTATHTLTPTPTASSTPSFTSIWTSTASYTPTRSSTPTPTSTGTPIWTGTPTLTPLFSFTPSYSPTDTSTSTATGTPTHTGTPTSTGTSTGTPTQTSTPTNTDSPTATDTPTITNTPTSTGSYTPTSTGTPTLTSTPSSTPTSAVVAMGTGATGTVNELPGAVNVTAVQVNMNNPSNGAVTLTSLTVTNLDSGNTSYITSVSVLIGGSPVGSPSVFAGNTAILNLNNTVLFAASGQSLQVVVGYSGAANGNYQLSITGLNGNSANNGGQPASFTGLPVAGYTLVVQPASPTPTLTSTSTQTPTATASPTQTISPTPTVTQAPTPLPGLVGIYPNPVSSPTVNILPPFYSGISDVRVEIITLAFRKAQDQTYRALSSGTPITLSLTGRAGNNLSNGLYYVVVTTNTGRAMGKLLILR